MAEPIRPDGTPEVGVPHEPARIVGVSPDLPADFNQGDRIWLDFKLDRRLSPLELRVLEDQNLSDWEPSPNDSRLSIGFRQVSQDTLSKVQTVLNDVNSRAAENARAAETTRSLLRRLIAEWGT